MDGHLAKPIDPKALQATLARHAVPKGSDLAAGQALGPDRRPAHRLVAGTA
jgi:hypothetical protein